MTGQPFPYTITFGDIDFQTTIITRYAILHGCAITVSLSFFLLLMLFIKNKKTPIFILNQAILAVSMIRSSLFLAYQLGPLGSLTTAFTGIVTPDNLSDYKVSVAANGVLIVLVFLIQLSFTYQIFTIFKSPEVKFMGFALSAFSVCLTLATFGFYVNSAVFSTKQYQSLLYNLDPVIYDSWVNVVPPSLFCASINFMSFILILKLIFAIRTRKYLGLKQFLSYHVLVIMFSQTLSIPTLLTIFSYRFSGPNDILVHVSLVLTSILLPFTSIWAALANNSRNLSSSALVYLTNSNTSSTASPYSDAPTLNGDTYSFFPEKLLKLTSGTTNLSGATEQDSISGSPIKNSVTYNLKEEEIDNLSGDSVPNDILEILKLDNLDDNSVRKQLSAISNETIDKIDTQFISKQSYNHKY